MRNENPGELRYWETDPPRPGVFLCYRWCDIMAGVALDLLLTDRLGDNRVFRADRSIKPGENFKQVLNEAALRSSAMLAIIGPGWAETLKSGQHEWALYEIIQAQEEGIPILPVYITRTHYEHEETGSDEWQPIERPHESLTAEGLPPGVNPSFLEAGYLTFGTSHPREEADRIIAALDSVVTDLGTIAT